MNCESLKLERFYGAILEKANEAICLLLSISCYYLSLLLFVQCIIFKGSNPVDDGDDDVAFLAYFYICEF